MLNALNKGHSEIIDLLLADPNINVGGTNIAPYFDRAIICFPFSSTLKNRNNLLDVYGRFYNLKLKLLSKFSVVEGLSDADMSTSGVYRVIIKKT